MTKTLENIFPKDDYLGRMIFAGLNPKNEKPYILYVLTGRSEESRNRKLVKKYPGLIINSTTNEKGVDPFVLYSPIYETKNGIIVGNGNHTIGMNEFYNLTNTPNKNLIDFFTNPHWDNKIDLTSYEPDNLSTPRIAAILQKEKIAFFKSYNAGKEKTIKNYSKTFKLEKDEIHYSKTYQGKKGETNKEVVQSLKNIKLKDIINVIKKNEYYVDSIVYQ